MMTIERGSRLTALIIVLAGLMFAPNTFADDMSDVMAIIYQYGDLENDLEAQAKLMRSDRVFIAQGIRQTDEAKNMANQIAGRKATESLNGGKTEFVTTIEGPVVSIHGDVAVASFVRWWNVYPHNQASDTSPLTWVTLVLIKESSGWLIKHTHQSPVLGD
tara:strand:- start:207 stop:689 length:483 start_codon:yes stop_codon:yes gene_type:complete